MESLNEHKFYIGGPFFNAEQLAIIESIENLLDKHNIEYFSPRKHGVVQDLKSLRENDPQAFELACQNIYVGNIVNINNCNGMISVIDDKDTGTMVEFGYAAAIRHAKFLGVENWMNGSNPFIDSEGNQLKYAPTYKLVTFTNEEYPVNIMLRQEVDAHVKGIEKLESIILKWKELGDFNRAIDALGGKDLSIDAF